MSRHHARPPSEWMRDAACLGVPELPWTTDTDDLDRRGPAVLAEVMADTCATCPVRADCAAYADANDICGGFWAGSDRANLPRAVWVTVRSVDGRVVEAQAALFPESGDAA